MPPEPAAAAAAAAGGPFDIEADEPGAGGAAAPAAHAGVPHVELEQQELQIDTERAQLVAYDDCNRLLLVVNGTQVLAYGLPSAPPANGGEGLGSGGAAPQEGGGGEGAAADAGVGLQWVTYIEQGPPVMAVRCSPPAQEGAEQQLLAMQRSDRLVEFKNRSTGNLFIQGPQRGRNVRVKGFFWTQSNSGDFVMVTSSGLELFHRPRCRAGRLLSQGLKPTDVHSHTVLWYRHSHDTRLLVLGLPQDSVMLYQFPNHQQTVAYCLMPIPSVSVLVPSCDGSSGEPTLVQQPVIQDGSDLHLLVCYRQVHGACLVGDMLVVMTFHSDRIMTKLRFRLPSHVCNFSVVDDLLIVHLLDIGQTYVFDLAACTTGPVCQPSCTAVRLLAASADGDDPSQAQQGLDSHHLRPAAGSSGPAGAADDAEGADDGELGQEGAPGASSAELCTAPRQLSLRQRGQGSADDRRVLLRSYPPGWRFEASEFVLDLRNGRLMRVLVDLDALADMAISPYVMANCLMQRRCWPQPQPERASVSGVPPRGGGGPDLATPSASPSRASSDAAATAAAAAGSPATDTLLRVLRWLIREEIPLEQVSYVLLVMLQRYIEWRRSAWGDDAAAGGGRRVRAPSRRGRGPRAQVHERRAAAAAAQDKAEESPPQGVLTPQQVCRGVFRWLLASGGAEARYLEATMWEFLNLAERLQLRPSQLPAELFTSLLDAMLAADPGRGQYRAQQMLAAWHIYSIPLALHLQQLHDTGAMPDGDALAEKMLTHLAMRSPREALRLEAAEQLCRLHLGRGRVLQATRTAIQLKVDSLPPHVFLEAAASSHVAPEVFASVYQQCRVASGSLIGGPIPSAELPVCDLGLQAAVVDDFL